MPKMLPAGSLSPTLLPGEPFLSPRKTPEDIPRNLLREILPPASPVVQVPFGISIGTTRYKNTCAPDHKRCDTLCIPSSGTCCAEGIPGLYCALGSLCRGGSCCPPDKTCLGQARSCAPDHYLCNGYCVPSATTCCANGTSCPAGQYCKYEGFCESDFGNPDVCDGARVWCGEGCMPFGQVCCTTYFCGKGEKCLGKGECSAKKKWTECAASQTRCGDGCMPTGHVCCETYHCFEGQQCVGEKGCKKPQTEVLGGNRPAADRVMRSVSVNNSSVLGTAKGRGHMDGGIASSSPSTGELIKSPSVTATTETIPPVTQLGSAATRHVEMALLAFAMLLVMASLVI